MAIKVGALEAKNKFSELMETVAYTKQRIIVERRGKPMMALVPVADVARLESMDSKEAIQARRQALEDWLVEAEKIRLKIAEELRATGQTLPSAADLIREAREERLNDLP
jgi:prevent-host-death family protein